MTLIEALRKQAEDMRGLGWLQLYANRCDQAADRIAELEAELARRDEAEGLRPWCGIKDSIEAERGDQLRDKKVDNE